MHINDQQADQLYKFDQFTTFSAQNISSSWLTFWLTHLPTDHHNNSVINNTRLILFIIN